MAKILVVDDMPDMADVICYFLKEDGHDVTIAYSSQEAKVRLRTDDYHILVTDLLMPGENGFELIQNVRAANSGHNEPKIIAITGGAHGIGAQNVAEIATDKADIVLKKPFTKEVLSKTIADLLAA